SNVSVFVFHLSNSTHLLGPRRKITPTGASRDKITERRQGAGPVFVVMLLTHLAELLSFTTNSVHDDSLIPLVASPRPRLTTDQPLIMGNGILLLDVCGRFHAVSAAVGQSLRPRSIIFRSPCFNHWLSADPD